MDKEEAIKILKNFHDKSALFSVRTALETLHPELKESEDEKVRKELLDFCKNRAEKYSNDPKYKNINAWIAWLEKQGNKDTQVILPTFTFDDVLALQCAIENVKKVQEDKDLYNKLLLLHNKVHDAYTITKNKLL